MAVIWEENTLYDYLLNPKKVQLAFTLHELSQFQSLSITSICCAHASAVYVECEALPCIFAIGYVTCCIGWCVCYHVPAVEHNTK